MFKKINPGPLWQFMGTVCFCALMTMNRQLSPFVQKELILLGRCFFALLFLMPFIRTEGLLFLWPFHLLRGFLTVGTMYCTYSAYRYVPTATMALFGTVTPLLTSFFGVIFLKEKMKKISLFALGMGMIGVSIVYWNDGVSALTHTVGYAPMASLMCAFSTTCGRFLVKKGAKPSSLLFYNIFIPFISFISISILFHHKADYHGIKNWKALLIMGLLGGLGQYCHVKTMQNIRLSLSAPLEYIRPLILIPIGFYYFSDVPKTSFYWGAFFVFLSVILSWVAIIRDNNVYSVKSH